MYDIKNDIAGIIKKITFLRLLFPTYLIDISDKMINRVPIINNINLYLE